MTSCSQPQYPSRKELRVGQHSVGPFVPRLTPLHQVLKPMASCARVAQCVEAIPVLLQAFFSAVTQVSPPPRCPPP